jgi:FAD:protein FMN transferase
LHRNFASTTTLMMTSKIIPLVALCAGALLPGQAQEAPTRYKESHNAMGTVFTVIAYGADVQRVSGAVHDAFEEIDRLDAEMSNYKAMSELSRINREAAQGPVAATPELFGLIQDSWFISKETEGAFDITIGPIVKAWGFFRGQGRVPSTGQIEATQKLIGYRHVRLDPTRREIRFDVDGIDLDLGAIAKGYAIDRAVEILRSHDVKLALVSSGASSIYALGSPPGERAWKVLIRDPYDRQKAADVVWLKNYSLSVSGNYEKFFKLNGKIYSHIIDPRTGWPAEGVLSTAVIAPTAEQSDALSTSCYVLNTERTRDLIANRSGVKVIFYLPETSEGKFKRVVVQPNSPGLPSNALAEIEH